MRPHLPALALLTLTLLGCGTGTDTERDPTAEVPATSEPATTEPADQAAGYPACDDIWQVGNTLPQGYEGCEDGDTIEAAVFVTCPAGEEFAYTSYQDALFGIPGQAIVETAGDAADLYADCQGTPRVTS